jgi:diguanylate cyclase (GGDEF)-like protein
MFGRKNANVWVFNTLLALGAVFLASAIGSASTPILPTPLGLPWYVMVAVAAAAELSLFSVRYRNDAQTFTLGEISYVLGAAFFPPTPFLIASALGLTVVFLGRRAPLTRLVFNVAATTIATCIVIATARALAGPSPETNSLRLWFGIIIGAAVACPVQAVLVGLVRSIAEGRLSALTESPKVIFFSELNSIAVASMGVLIAIVLSVAPAAAIVGFVPLALLYFAFSQLVGEHTQRTNIEFLYETAQNIHNTPDMEEAFTNLLNRSLTSFRADFGAVLLERPDSSQWVTFCVGQTVGGTTSVTTQPHWFPAIGNAVVIRRESANADRLLLLDQLGANQVLISTLSIDVEARSSGERVSPKGRAHAEVHGVLLVADRSNTDLPFNDNDRRLFELLANQVAIGVENSQLERSLGILSRLEEELRHQANHDALTGLANRAMLNEALQRTNDSDSAVLLIDLDDFKAINDSLGHNAGDEVLIEVSQRLRRSVRSEDLVARLGGDEFAIVLSTNVDRDRAIEAAERVSIMMGPPMTIAGSQVRMHASIGVAVAAAGVSLQEVLRSADVAMYQAKSAGKGQHRLFESGMDDSARQRLQIINGLPFAASENQLVIAYQPIIDLRSHTVVGVEALVRWDHPELGRLSPDRFIHLAEETNEIGFIGEWVLKQACLDIGPMANDAGTPLEIHVNVSPQQIADVDFVATVIGLLTETQIDPSRVVLEITEKTALADSTAVVENVIALRSIGVRLALDDFGTGYSSLAAAHSFPLDLIKIDQLFIRAINAQSEASLVRAILAMADSLELLPVAEGIESQEQLDKLVELGCRYGQGYLFSEPLPSESLRTWRVDMSQQSTSHRPTVYSHD